MSEGNGFTPIQKCMMGVLSDGLSHTGEELHGCLYDTLGPMTNIAAHLTGMRKILRSKGQDVVFERAWGKPHYRLVTLISDSD